MSIRTFLDANVLAKPFTRTLLWAGAQGGDFHVAWSELAEEQATRHMRQGMATLAVLRERFGLELSPIGVDPERFQGTAPSDRQILADAEAADAHFLITEDVDDFALEDLTAAGMSAVHPDLFLAHHLTPSGYLRAVSALSANSRNPHRTPADVHSAAGRQHPLLTSARSAVFPGVEVAPAAHQPATVQFRGSLCLACAQELAADQPGPLCCA